MVTANDNDWQLPVEIWLTVPSRPELEASSHGRIRVVPWVGKMPCGSPRTYGGQPSFGQINSASKEARSLFFNLCYRRKNTKVHFAVCEAFHGKNPSGKRGVRHLNENGLDNRPENLMWSDQKTNLNDPFIKRFHHRRVSPFLQSDLTPSEKRAGIYDNIRDIGVFQRAMRAANDNERAVLAQGAKHLSQKYS